ncbi:7215_t:CDS:2 [Ambispora gerdemannii]|uniref:7215_t:CDS:1 n=1 Tax=Ambispora gerdemannii TaxID=144530 RepID=A0A9N9AW12_9GLOM|nr:7215_t:CDS:2 [Ambispora gerdemannii]
MEHAENASENVQDDGSDIGQYSSSESSRPRRVSRPVPRLIEEIRNIKKKKKKTILDVPKKLNNRERNDDILRALHKLIFDIIGDSGGIKKRLRRFSGFVFESEEEEKYALLNLELWTSEDIRECLSLFDVKTTGDKDALVERMFNFLKKPYDVNTKRGRPRKLHKKITVIEPTPMQPESFTIPIPQSFDTIRRAPRHKSPLQIFFTHQRPIYKSRKCNKNASRKEIEQQMAAAYNRLSVEKKQKYIDIAEHDNHVMDEAYLKYTAALVQSSSRQISSDSAIDVNSYLDSQNISITKDIIGHLVDGTGIHTTNERLNNESINNNTNQMQIQDIINNDSLQVDEYPQMPDEIIDRNNPNEEENTQSLEILDNGLTEMEETSAETDINNNMKQEIYEGMSQAGESPRIVTEIVNDNMDESFEPLYVPANAVNYINNGLSQVDEVLRIPAELVNNNEVLEILNDRLRELDKTRAQETYNINMNQMNDQNLEIQLSTETDIGRNTDQVNTQNLELSMTAIARTGEIQISEEIKNDHSGQLNIQGFELLSYADHETRVQPESIDNSTDQVTNNNLGLLINALSHLDNDIRVPAKSSTDNDTGQVNDHNLAISNNISSQVNHTQIPISALLNSDDSDVLVSTIREKFHQIPDQSINKFHETRIPVSILCNEDDTAIPLIHEFQSYQPITNNVPLVMPQVSQEMSSYYIYGIDDRSQPSEIIKYSSQVNVEESNNSNVNGRGEKRKFIDECDFL